MAGAPHSSWERALSQLWGHPARAAPPASPNPWCLGRSRGWAQPLVQAKHSVVGMDCGAGHCCEAKIRVWGHAWVCDSVSHTWGWGSRQGTGTAAPGAALDLPWENQHGMGTQLMKGNEPQLVCHPGGTGKSGTWLKNNETNGCADHRARTGSARHLGCGQHCMGSV